MIALALGLLAGAGVFAVSSVALARPRRGTIVRLVEANLGAPVAAPIRREGETGLRAALDAFLATSEQRLEGRAGWARASARVESAGVPLRAVEVLYLTLGIGVLVGVVGAATGTFVLLLLAPPGALALAWAVLGVLSGRRLHSFEEQLPDLLATLGASLRAGHGLMQSLQAVALDAPDPAGKELKRVIAETRLGRPLEDALVELGRRVPSRDLAYVITAIGVQRQVGGSLAGLFDTVNATVLHRRQFVRKVRSLTGTVRMSAFVLLALPPGLGLLLTLANRSYMAPLWHDPLGRMLALVATVLMAVGAIVLRKMSSFDE